VTMRVEVLGVRGRGRGEQRDRKSRGEASKSHNTSLDANAARRTQRSGARRHVRAFGSAFANGKRLACARDECGKQGEAQQCDEEGDGDGRNGRGATGCKSRLRVGRRV
jgi:hypothetical protein